MGFIDFTNGEVLTADQMDTVIRQSVMRFADASARDTALSAVLAEGLMCYLDDTNEVLKYDGSSWIDISGDITGVTAGTALTGGGTSGNVTLDVDETALTIAQSQVTDLTTDLAGKQADVITTQGDLVIGDGSGDASRLAIGAADTVLTSNGTTATWVAGGSGGGQSFVNLPYNQLSVIDVNFPADTVVRFGIISTSSDPFTVELYDSSANSLDIITVDRDNPFTYFTNATAVANLAITNDVIDEKAVLIFSDPTAATDPDQSKEILTYTTSQSVTLTKTFDVYVFGAGGGGGSSSGPNANGAAGGGSGYLATGTYGAGTYTITIGAGGSASSAGGSTSFDATTAAGGQGGDSVSNGSTGDGGDGGSGGGSGAVYSIHGSDNAGGGTDGGNGDSLHGTGGTGSGTPNPDSTIAESATFPVEPQPQRIDAAGLYQGGGGGNEGNVNNGTNGLPGGGGTGASSSGSNGRTGGTGGDGIVILIEA